MGKCNSTQQDRRAIDCVQRSSKKKKTEAQQSPLNNVEDLDFEKRLAVVKVLLELGVPVNSKSETLGTPLHFAVRNNCFEVAQLLVEYKADVDEVDQDRRTPLHLCAQFSDSKMADLLLKHCEMRPKAVGKKYEMPEDVNTQEFQLAILLLKCWKNQADEMRCGLIILLKVFMEYHRKELFDEQSLREDSCNCISLLESAYYALITITSSSINWKTFWISYQDYKKALRRYHSKRRNFTMIKLRHRIIDYYIGIWMKDSIEQLSEMMFENNATALHLAVGYCCRSPILNGFQLQLADALFMKNNDKAPITDSKEKTKENMLIDFFTGLLEYVDEHKINSTKPVDYNASNECLQSKTRQMTKNLKSYVNRKDSEGYDALLKSVEFNKPDLIQLLLSNGADTCSLTSQGYAALHTAVNSIHNVLKSSNPVEMINVLLTFGKFSVNALTFKAETPLHLAIGNCCCGLPGQDSEECRCRRELQDSIILLLLEYKANVNKQDCEGMTPLMIASERGCHHIVKMLLHGNFVKVDLDARDKYGETALIKAARMHHAEIVEVLVNSGARVDLHDYREFTALHAALHDPNEFSGPFDLFESQSQDIGPRNNEANEEVLIGVKNSLKGEGYGENNTKNTIIKILVRNGLQFDTLDFANNTAFDFLVDSEIQSSRNEQEAQKRLDKIRNENDVYKETPCNLHRRWLNIKWRRESPLFWLAAVCIGKAENKSIKPEEAQKIQRIKDYKGRTLLHYVAMSTGYEKLADKSSLFKILLNSGCKIDEKDIYQRTPLHYLDDSSSSLLFGTVRQIGMESSEPQQLILKEIFKMKDVDDKTVDDLQSLREGNAERERDRKSDFHKAVKAVNLTAMRYDNGSMKIDGKATYNFKTSISWSIWTNGIADYAYRNTVTSCLTEEIHHFIERLANAIERKDPSFKCQPMLVGSAFEGTKIGSPDEFDFDFILTNFSNMVEVIPSPVAPVGFVHLRKKPNVVLRETYERFFDKEGILKTNEINCRFQIILSQVFRDPSFWDDEHLFELTDADETMKKFVRCYDRHKNGRDLNDLTDQRINPCICTTIRLKQTRALDGEYLPNDISLDLVPCIHVDGWWPDKTRSDISDTLKSNGCNLVFDQPQRKHPSVPFGENYARISFAPAECQIIRDRSPTAKAAYMVCKHLIKDKPQMTYVLKTCLLYCIDSSDREEERSIDEEANYSSVKAEKLGLRVENMMRCYLKYFLQDFCPCYLMPSFRLPIGEFLESNNVLLRLINEDDYEFLKEENKSYRCSIREVYSTNFDLFRRVCIRRTDIPLPKPQPKPKPSQPL